MEDHGRHRFTGFLGAGYVRTIYPGGHLLTMLGLNQSFGIWQKHYGSEAAVADGILRAGDMRQRAAIAAIGSLSNGGIVAAFAMLYYPNLPRIGKHIKTLCYIGTLLISIGFAAAAGSTHVSTHDVCLEYVTY